MDIITIIILIGAAILILPIGLVVAVISLSSRVKRLERLIAAGGATAVSAVTQSTVEHLESTVHSPVVQHVENMDALSTYVRNELSRGITRDSIRQALLAKGWQEEAVSFAFSKVGEAPLRDQVTSPAPGVVGGGSVDDPITAWFKKDLLLKIGALFLIIGFGWLVSYAFMNNWIGPVGRITLGILAGSLFMVFGWIRMQKYTSQGSVFLVLGSTVTMLTVFAARGYYDFFTPLSSLVIMFLCSAFVAVASMKYQRRSLAIVGVIMAFIAPLFTHGNGDYIGLFSYLIVVTIGSVFVDAYVGKREVGVIALILVAMYSFPYLTSAYMMGMLSADRGVILLFIYGFVAIFFIANIIATLNAKEEENNASLLGAAGSVILLVLWVLNAAPTEWQSMIFSAWMLVFGVGAFLVSRAIKRNEPFYVYALASIGLLAAATAAELSGAALTIAYTIEATGIALSHYLLSEHKKGSVSLAALIAVPAVMTLPSFFSSLWYTGALHKDFFVLIVMGSSLLFLGTMFTRHFKKTGEEEMEKAGGALLIVGSFYLYALVWLTLGATVGGSAAVTMALVLYTLIGLWFYFVGTGSGNKGYRLYGGALLVLVIVRLLIIDVREMEMAGRIVTFFTMGILLVSTAFIGRKKHTELSSSVEQHEI